MPERPSPPDQLFDIGAALLRQTLQSSFELGAAALNASSKLHEAALAATSEISTAALNATSTFFTQRDRIHLEDSPVGVLHLDEGLRVLLSNSTAQSLIGRTIAFGEALDQVLPFEDPTSLHQRIIESVSGAGSFVSTVEVRRQDNTTTLPIPVRVHIERFPSSPGQHPALMAVLTRLPLENLRLISHARTRLLEICAREQSPETVLRGVLDVLCGVVPFEIATYYEYAEGGDDAVASDTESSGHIRRIRFALDRRRPGFAWPMRWMSVPKAIDEWTRSPEPLISDLEEFISGLSEASAEHLRQHISTQAAMRENLRSFLYFPYWRGAHIVSALSFASRTPRQFTPLHREALCAIGLPQVLELIGAAYDRSSDAFCRRIANLFQSGAVPAQLAHNFVREIAEEYRWDYVGIFRAAQVSGHFRVVAQHDNTGELTIKQDFLQPIHRGVLGTVLRENRPIRISDVDTEGEKFDYIKLGANKSCMCFPISVGGNVEWILDCESTQQAAFAKPDEDALADLINSLQATLGLWFEMHLSDALLEQIRQGVVVAGAGGTIERMNAKARQLFGMRDGKAQGQKLGDYAGDASGRDVFGKSQAVDNKHLKILGADKIERGVLATSILSGEAFNRWIWLFTDTAEREWLSSIRYARATIEQVASQAHGPLILASALIKRLAATISEPEMRGENGRRLLLRILRTLSKADLTYERLAQALALREQIEVSRLIDRFAARLPQEQRAALQLQNISDHAAVRCSSDSLCRALASVYEHLYELRVPNTPITCWVEEEPRHVAVGFDAQLTQSPQSSEGAVSDKLTQVEAAARFAAALPDLAQKISSDRPSIERARWDLLDEGGELIETTLPDNSHRMQIRLIKAIPPEQVTL